MANKVASKRWIYSNFSVGSSSNECATKTEILGFGLYITNDSSYASNQLVREEDIYFQLGHILSQFLIGIKMLENLVELLPLLVYLQANPD